MDGLLKRLLVTFKLEADDHLRTMAAGLLALEQGLPAAAQGQTVETFYREVHSLKGAARATNLIQIESLCQPMESLLGRVKRQQLSLAAPHYDLLHRALDMLADLVATGVAGQPVANPHALTGLLEELGAAEKAPQPPGGPALAGVGSAAPLAPPAPSPIAGTAVPPAPPVATASVTPPATTQTVAPPISAPASAPGHGGSGADAGVRIATHKLTSLMLQAEEMLALKLAAAQQVRDVRELVNWVAVFTQQQATVTRRRPGAQQPLAAAREAQTAQASVAATQQLREQVAQYRQRDSEVERRLRMLLHTAEQHQQASASMVNRLREEVRQVVHLPLAAILAGMPKMVRDLAREQDKDVSWNTAGAEVELDKRVLDELRDPLLHLVRNSLGHGIEPAAERRQLGKPPRGSIALSAVHRDGSTVELCLRDDGAGINVANVKAVAVREGLLASDAADSLSEAAALDLVFQSGLSTSPTITRLSGRGLGLAIVRDKLHQLGGSIAVETTLGVGTTFRLVVPVSRTTMHGVLVKAAGHLLVVPSQHLARVARWPRADIQRVAGRDTIALDQQAVPLVSLAAVLALPPVGTPPAAGLFVELLVLGPPGAHLAFAVDQLVQDQEVLVKPLAKPLLRLRHVAAVTILGTGQVVPILQVGELLRSAQRQGTLAAAASSQSAAIPAAAPAILIAEDSMTSRLLLLNILESAGYRVQTAVDGAAAWEVLQRQPFDLLVSDVQMPHLDGYELTAKVRSDATLAELPVVLLTSLAARADQERGLAAGASAYLVKGDFDQGHLLDVIRRLI